MKDKCRQIQPLLAGYALGAVDRDEKARLDSHLADCVDCQRELEEYYRVKEGLLYMPQASQPAGRVRQQLEARTSPEPAASPPRQGGLLNWNQVGRIAVAVGILLLIVLNVGLMREVRELSRQQERFEQQSQAYQASLALLTYYDTRVVELSSGDAYGTLIFEPDREIGVLNVRGLDEVPADRVYQIWLIEADQNRVSGGLFSVESGADGYVSFVIDAPKPFQDFEAIGITIEPAGGSPGPTGPKVIGTDL